MPDLRRFVERETKSILGLCRTSAVQDWKGLARECCAADEWRRASRFHFDWLGRRFLCGRTLLRHLVGRVDGREPRSVRLGTTSMGQLLVLDSDVSVSVSYSEDLVVVLVGAGPLGVDIEEVHRQSDIASVARQAFREEERRILEELNPDEKRHYFFRVWVEKEAVAKALGLGVSIGFERLDARRKAIEMGAALRTFWLTPSCLAATVVPNTCRGIVKVEWDGVCNFVQN